MNELLYQVNTGVIVLVLLLTMAAAIEGGYRYGRRKHGQVRDAQRDHINGVQASVLGILALVLGFTFSLSLQRFDSRSDAVVDEANAIGTAYLRVQLLPPSMQDAAREALRSYTELRVRSSRLVETDQQSRSALVSLEQQAQTVLWDHARKGMDFDPQIYAPALFVEAVNDVLDSYGKREAALKRHVPELVLFLLYATFLITSAIVGYSCGIANHRPSFTSHLMVLLVVVLVFIILDLDRPRRGFIQVSQQSLLDLQASMRAPSSSAAAPLMQIPAKPASAVSR
jgi:hypothetical protein